MVPNGLAQGEGRRDGERRRHREGKKEKGYHWEGKVIQDAIKTAREGGRVRGGATGCCKGLHQLFLRQVCHRCAGAGFTSS